jgi:hypothetical protein
MSPNLKATRRPLSKTLANRISSSAFVDSAIMVSVMNWCKKRLMSLKRFSLCPVKLSDSILLKNKAVTLQAFEALEAGLEIMTKQGTWLPVTMLPGAIVVNIGDMMQRLTEIGLLG